MRPLCAIDIDPVSSDTTTAIASVASGTKGSTVAQSHLALRRPGEDTAGRKRHHASAGNDLVIADDHRAIMQRRVGVKDLQQ